MVRLLHGFVVILNTPCFVSLSPSSFPKVKNTCHLSLSSYFKTVVYPNNDLTSHPSQIFNCDETSMPLSPKPVKLKMNTKQGAKITFRVGGNDKVQITVLACVSASGYSIQPMVLFDRKILCYQFTVLGRYWGTMYGLWDKSWMDLKLFHL